MILRIALAVALTIPSACAVTDEVADDALDESIEDSKADAPATTDPADPASCRGALLADPATLFSSGSLAEELGPTTVVWQERDCNALTGCTSWLRIDEGYAGVLFWPAAAWLDASTGVFRLKIRERGRDEWATCSLAGGLVACSPRRYMADDSRSITLSGQIRKHCARITGRVQTLSSVDGKPNGHEMRLSILARY